MSSLYWLQPGWTDALCGSCGVNIHATGGDPDWGYCMACMQSPAAAPPPVTPCDHYFAGVLTRDQFEDVMKTTVALYKFPDREWPQFEIVEIAKLDKCWGTHEIKWRLDPSHAFSERVGWSNRESEQDCRDRLEFIGLIEVKEARGGEAADADAPHERTSKHD